MNENSTFWNFGMIKTMMQGTQIDNSAIEKFSTIKKYPRSTLMEEIKPIASMNGEFEEGKKIKLEGFQWNFWTISFLIQKKKTMIF